MSSAHIRFTNARARRGLSWVTAEASLARLENFGTAGCSGFCRDECMAIAMVAAAQQSSCPALKACAFALLESSDLENVVHATSEFASALVQEGIHLNRDSVALAPAALERSTRAAAH